MTENTNHEGNQHETEHAQEHVPFLRDHWRTESSAQINEIAAALAAAQSEIEGAAKDSLNPHFKSSYADLASVWDACHGALSKNKIAVMQQVLTLDGELTLITKLVHASGQWFRSEYPVRPTQNNPQGIGSALTYARRYSLMAMAGVAGRDDDDDGNAASGRGPSGGGGGGHQPQNGNSDKQWREVQPPADKKPERAGPTKFAAIADDTSSLPADIAGARRELKPYEGKLFTELDDGSLAAMHRVLDEMSKKASDNDNKVNLATLSAIVSSEIGKRVKEGAA